MPRTPVRTILFLAANPLETRQLRLDEEVREIDEGLRRSRQRRLFKLVQKWAVRTFDLRRGLLDNRPTIVHFSGHGTASKEIIVEDENGNAKPLNPQALTELFELCADDVECVVLNACYSESQAAAIAQHINYVIGMSTEIGDEAAIAFATGFYDALGAGRSYEDAFRFGCGAIAIESIPENLTPKIKVGPKSGPSRQGHPVKEQNIFDKAWAFFRRRSIPIVVIVATSVAGLFQFSANLQATWLLIREFFISDAQPSIISLSLDKNAINYASETEEKPFHRASGGAYRTFRPKPGSELNSAADFLFTVHNPGDTPLDITRTIYDIEEVGEETTRGGVTGPLASLQPYLHCIPHEVGRVEVPLNNPPFEIGPGESGSFDIQIFSELADKRGLGWLMRVGFATKEGQPFYTETFQVYLPQSKKAETSDLLQGCQHAK